MPEGDAPAARGERGDAFWRELVRRELLPLALPERRADEVVEELAQLLRDAAADAGVSRADDAALRRWLRSEVPEWRALAGELRHAEHPVRERLAGGRASGALRRSMSTRSEPMSGILRDFRLALRALRKTPVFTVVAVLTLGLGIGLNAAAFSFLDAFLFRPLPVAAEGSLVRVYAQFPNSFFSHEPISYPDYLDIGREVEALESVAGYAMTFAALEAEGAPEMVIAEMVTGTYFETLGARMALGRPLDVSDDRRADPQPVVVLSHAAWQRRFGGDPRAEGSELLLNGRRMTVVGVAERGFGGLTRGIEPQVWMTVSLAQQVGASPSAGSGDTGPGVELLDARGRRWLWVIGRRAEGAGRAALEGQLEGLSAGLRERFPESHEEASLTWLRMRDVKLMPGIDSGLNLGAAVLMGVVALVLLVAAANLANLLLARAVTRRREIATRLSLGATRRLVVRQLLVESLVLSLLGGALGLAIAALSNRLLGGISLPFTVPIGLTELTLDPRVVVFTFAVAAVTALLFGLVPAAAASRTRLAAVLREDSGRGGGRWRRRIQGALVVVQVSVSLLLLVFAGLTLRSVLRAQHLDPGLDPNGVVGAMLDPSMQGYGGDEVASFYRRLREDLETLPGVASVTMPSHLPLSLWINTNGMVRDGEQDLAERDWPDIDASSVDDGYFRTLRIPLIAGRTFSAEDLEQGRRVVVVNETLAARFWPEGGALGGLIRTGRSSDPWEVIGVVADGRYRTLGEDPRPFAFFPIRESWASRTLAVRFERPEQASPRVVAGAIHAIDPHLAIANSAPLEEVMSPSLLPVRAGAVAFTVFGVLGLLLASLGLYGVLAHMVSQRRHEIGVRVAMGANQASIVGLVVRDGLRLTALGALLGVGGAVVTARVLAGILYGISPTDLPTYLLVVGVLVGVAFLACYLPALRASRADPIRALRVE
ncbi:MAG TPA: ADOP family duplicated permease [Thermoanaerobaculia bacterium]|nr:ADOP family duplicated permease [Thermoanaerobaculia bacterium]